MRQVLSLVVTPAKAGVQVLNKLFKIKFTTWIPAFAGVTILVSSGFCPPSASLATQDPDHASAQIETIVQKKKIDKKTVVDLIDALKDPATNIKVKERAAWALGELRARSAGPALIEAAKNRGLLVRSAALNALVRMRARSALKTYIEIAENDPILSLRQNATIALGLLQWEKAIPEIVKLSSDKTPEVRGAAALGMGATHSKKNDFSQAIKEMEADENPYVQERARRAMDVVRRKNASVLEQLKSQDMDVRLFAAVYFHHHGTSKELKDLKDAWNSEADEETRHELSQAITAIKKRAAQKPAAPKKKSPAQKSAG